MKFHRVSAVSARVFIMAEGVTVLDELRAKLVTLNAEVKGIQAKADGEKRAMTEEEKEKVAGIFAAFETTEAEIARREKMEAINAKVSAAQPRVTQPAPHIEVKDRLPEGHNGFKSLGEFAQVVKAAVRSRPDERLIRNAQFAGDTAAEGVNADGGYIVPPDFREAILSRVMGEESLLSRTDQYNTSVNSITFPRDDVEPWDSVNGIQASWELEAQQKTATKPVFGQTTVRANKLTALVPVTDELLEDVPAISSYLARKTPEVFTSKLNDAILNGSGTNQPLGILDASNAALITQAAETSQTTFTILFENVIKMWSRLYAPFRRNAVWLINQDAEPQLNSLAFPSSNMPVYLPPGGLSASPYGLLFGRPVIPVEACAALGYVGDIVLADLGQYLSLVKGGIRSQASIHLWFDYDITAFKFVMRVGGQPWLESTISRAAAGANTLSAYVALAARTA